ncbi:hypothetical protein L6R29_18695 [Myxococcota bacterium]|nr:hypothetical protein [Myxococcota bacterium]
MPYGWAATGGCPRTGLLQQIVTALKSCVDLESSVVFVVRMVCSKGAHGWLWMLPRSIGRW